MRDARRQRVYDWERAAVPGWQEGEWRPEVVRRYHDAQGQEHVFRRQRCRIADELPLAACALLVGRVWGDYRPGRTPPRVTPGDLARSATGSRHRINLPRWSRQPPVVLHELTHSLLPNDVASHGPEFVRLFVELLVRYWQPSLHCRAAMLDRGISEGALRGHLLHSARAAGLKVGRLDRIIPPATPARRREWKSKGYLTGV